jgi:hypothetical protein
LRSRLKARTRAADTVLETLAVDGELHGLHARLNRLSMGSISTDRSSRASGERS